MTGQTVAWVFGAVDVCAAVVLGWRIPGGKMLAAGIAVAVPIALLHFTGGLA